MMLRYFMGTATDKPASRHMYRVSTELLNDVPQCVTCSSVNADQKECSYNNVEFSTNLRYYVHGCDGPYAPRSVIKESAVSWRSCLLLIMRFQQNFSRRRIKKCSW